MRYELLIFDWDGTLANSAGQIVATLQDAIRALGLPPREDREIADLIGLSIVDGVRRLYPEYDPGEVLKLIAGYRELAPAQTFRTLLFDGAADALAHLHGGGYRLAIATGKPRVGLDRSLEYHPRLQRLFSITRCADESADKPHPLMLEQILAETGVTPERALMIGDTEYDVEMARAIGVTALGVACGVHTSDRLLRAGACAVVADVGAIPDWLSA